MSASCFSSSAFSAGVRATAMAWRMSFSTSISSTRSLATRLRNWADSPPNRERGWATFWSFRARSTSEGMRSSFSVEVVSLVAQARYAAAFGCWVSGAVACIAMAALGYFFGSKILIMQT